MNKKESLLCAIIAQSTYINQCNEADFCITAKFSNQGTDTQGLLGVAYDNTFVVAFRGSEETGIADWITDLKILQQVFPYGKKGDQELKVHYGFMEAYNSVREAAIKAIKETPHSRVVCTGHSLGGALATLCALDVAYNVAGKTVFCYTYGSPKVGDEHFVKVYNQKVPNTFRFVNGSDMIPGIPAGPYAHIGQMQFLGKGTEPGYGWDEIVAWAKDKMEDHFPHNYIKALRDWL